MRTRLVLKPGQPGTKRMVAKYGDRLVCVRYRYDRVQGKRYKTVELVEAETDWLPALSGRATVLVRVIWGEIELARQVKQAGGRWNRERQGWELSYERVVALGLEERVMGVLDE